MQRHDRAVIKPTLLITTITSELIANGELIADKEVRWNILPTFLIFIVLPLASSAKPA